MSLEVKNITKSFADKILFSDFSYKFENTGIYAVIGESGVGKTTLFRIICGLDNDFSGEIVGGGVKNVAVAFQEYRLFPHLTALENAYLPNGEISEKEAEELLLYFGFKKNELSLKPAQLSGGMKQRVSLVRAFLRKKPILLLDEPTKELDAEIRRKLYEQITKEANKRLVIMISHHMEDYEELNAVKIYI